MDELTPDQISLGVTRLGSRFLLYPHHEGLSANEHSQTGFRIAGMAAVIKTASINAARAANIPIRLRKQQCPVWNDRDQPEPHQV